MSSTAVEHEIKRLEAAYWQAVKDQDADTCATLSADPCIIAGSQGLRTIPREEMRAMMSQQLPYRLDHFTLSDLSVNMLSADIGVITYKVNERLTVEGVAVEFDAADISVWKREEGKWTCAFHTESILGDPFGRDRA